MKPFKITPIETEQGTVWVSNELPKNGECWIYLSPENWIKKEPIIPTIANSPEGLFEKLWDRDNYKTVIAQSPTMKLPRVAYYNPDAEIEKEAINQFQDIKHSQSRSDLKVGFIAGCKFMQSKGCYSDEQMIDAVKYGFDKRDKLKEPEHLEFDQQDRTEAKQFIQSLNQLYTCGEVDKNGNLIAWKGEKL